MPHRTNAEEARARPKLPSPEEIAQLPPDGGPDWNRLVFEQSPYLLQHAANPVDWYPWGQAAFEAAREQKKPIFLSIGYATCHWCHVMEHESFEDDEVARLMNEYFISIKVDREERPDVDHIYMTVAQAMTGHGGWPLNVVLTPDRKPFFAGTYFPKEGRMGRPGMMQLVPAIGRAWREDHENVVASANQIASGLQAMALGAPGEALGEEALAAAYDQLERSFDDERGGFGHRPKFPTPHNLTFLLRYWKRTRDERALDMVTKTLTEMRRGGIFDHVGFGFHRYSTDPEWFLPHFEKMLYDQAQLAMAYIEAWQATGDEHFSETAHEILTYVLRDMKRPEGGFYSAEDADSEGEEGKFYLWTTAEVRSVLDDVEAQLFIDVYNLTEQGNFYEEATGHRTGGNIPYLKDSWDALAEEHGMSVPDLRDKLRAARVKLFAVREQRVHPLKDDKALTDWNGLMIAALGKAGQALDNPEYVQAAREAADFILEEMRTEDGRLRKRFRKGSVGLNGLVEDYAFMVWGLIELYEATFEPRYLREALALNDKMLELFWDKENGGLFMSPEGAEDLIVRAKEVYDGAIPSGNSVAALNLLRLARLTGRTEYEDRAEAILRAFSEQVKQAPRAFTQLLCAVDFMLGPSYEIVISGRRGADDTEAMLDALYGRFLPKKVVLLKPMADEAGAAAVVELAPYAETQVATNGGATVYVCRDFACQAPTNDVDEMLAALGQ